MAVPDTPHYHDALAKGDTLPAGRRPSIHWLQRGKERWVAERRAGGWRIVDPHGRRRRLAQRGGRGKPRALLAESEVASKTRRRCRRSRR
jgi:hypothetical protein